VFELMKVFTQ